jgi:hypothetical protein
VAGNRTCVPPSSPPPPSTSLRLRHGALALAAVAASWAAVVATTGGGTLQVGDLRVSSRSAWRPALAALLLIGAALWRATADERRQLLAAIGRGADRIAPWLAGTATMASVAVAAVLGAHVAGGADSSGYISQSQLWAAGRVTAPAAVLVDAPWPDRGRLVSPLGYRPSTTVDELGPTYAPGLPWLMAAGAAVLGDAGRYIWTPLGAGILVWGTYALAVAAAPPAVALGAALLVAGSPPVLWESMQTMSDLPVAALWLWVLLWLRQRGARATIGAGAVAAVALAVRPNLVLAAGAVWLASIAADGGPAAVRLLRAAIRAVPLAVAALAVALINTRLWGSPFISGYGPASEIFAADNVIPNLTAVWGWMVQTRSYWTMLGLVALAGVARRRDGARWWTAIGLAVGVFANYLPYAQFVEWWYLRFYLPVWPVAAAALTVALWRGAGRWAPEAARLAIVAAALVTALHGVAYAHRHEAFALWRGEARYAAVGAYVRTHASDDAVIFAVQHSGAISYYGERAIARFDEVPGDAFDELCVRLATTGRDVWLVADEWEEREIRARFAGQVRGRLDWAPLAEARAGTARVRVYDLTAPTRATGPDLIPVATHGPWPWARRAGRAK